MLLKLLKSEYLILSLILLLGLIFRTYNLAAVPPGLTWDEAALGYNAYSITQTLRDEYGNFLPLTLVSFGDYKPALYAYLAIPFILTLGLTEIAVRIPSVIAGMGIIILSFLFIRDFFKNKWLALSVAFFAAISPLAIMFSRAAWESNVAVFLNFVGLYFFLKALKNSKLYIPSAIFFSLSLFCYQSSKIYVPIIMFGLFLFFWRQVKLTKLFIASLALVILSLTFVFGSTFLFGQADRLAVQNYFAYNRVDDVTATIVNEDGHQTDSFYFQSLHGEWWYFLSGIIERYLVYFSPKTLFVDGDYSPRHSTPDLGILNFYALIFIPFGFYLLWRKEENERKIIFFLLFTAMIPAVLSRDLISMVRALNLTIPLIILEGFGFYFLIKKLSAFLHSKTFITAAAFLVIVFLNLALWADFYFIHLPKEYATDWMYGYKEAVTQNYDFSKYDKVVMTSEYGQPYIYYLFYTKYPPEKFQSQAVLEKDTIDVGTVKKIDNIEFRKVNWPSDRGLQNTLIIGTGEEIPEGDIVTEKKSKKLFDLPLTDGTSAIKVVENGYDIPEGN